MQLQFKTQDFQVDAAEAICKIFQGQEYQGGDKFSYRVKEGDDASLFDNRDIVGYHNAPIGLTDEQILANLRSVQIAHNLKPSESLAVNAPSAGKPEKKRSKKAKAETLTEPEASATPEVAPVELKYNFTVEMETGVGKTYTYIKTMHELYRQYGWRKFIVIVPSVAIREGVYKSFQIMREHFQEQYAKSPDDDRPNAIISPCFIYNSDKLEEIQSFASSPYISVMIINAQAFNTQEKARGKSALRIYQRLDNFGSRRPIDLIAATNPILIIDEPQSVEGEQTRKMLPYFNPLMTLRYSATPREQYDLVYRLSAIDAYNKKLVKKIAVKGIHESNVSPTGAYIYLESINLSESAPTATLEIYDRKATKLRHKNLKKGDDLYAVSNEYEGYKGYVIESIDGHEGVVRFLNGVTIRLGEVVGKTNEEQLRRIQIRETIESHLEKERELYRAVPGVREGVKVLSLFFIDEVAKYRDDKEEQGQKGVYARIFEEEYDLAVSHFQAVFGEEPYLEPYLDYLRSIETSTTHVGYFYKDKKGRMINDYKETQRKDAKEIEVDAYDLIMKDKERLLDLDAKRSPARFIFSHSALREGWDNPNVFQICTLKQSASETRKRQEVGRGMRLCVDQSGKRLDVDALGDAVQRVNKLTVITNESYADYVAALQTEIAEASPDIPKRVTSDLFFGKVLHSDIDRTRTITLDRVRAERIVNDLVARGYVDSEERRTTDAFYAAVNSNTFQCDAVEKEFLQSVIDVLDTVYKAPEIENDKGATFTFDMNPEQYNRREFRELWERINAKTYYLASFNSEEVIKKAIDKLNSELNVPKSYFQVRYGEMRRIESKAALVAGDAFEQVETHTVDATAPRGSEGDVKYDLVGKLAEATCMTRREIVRILTGITDEKLTLFPNNPEQFIEQAARLINDAKVTAIVEHISYRLTDDKHGCEVFAEPLRHEHSVFTAPYLKTSKKHLYTPVLCDSKVERDFAEELESASEVVVYVKLPGGFYIPTPYGKYNPDWAIAFDEDAADVKHIYFVAETKGSTESCQLRGIEDAKIKCAEKHFKEIVKAVVGEERRRVQYVEVKSYGKLLDIVKG